jgi:hypothetical protein
MEPIPFIICVVIAWFIVIVPIGIATIIGHDDEYGFGMVRTVVGLRHEAATAELASESYTGN